LARQKNRKKGYDAVRRVENTVRNTKAALLASAVMLCLNLLSRRVFLQTLGERYLGMQGVFANLFGVLSLAEVGVGAAITYALYQPLANKDMHLVGAYMRAYAKAYRTVGLVILLGGLALMPFVQRLFPDLGEIQGVSWFYLAHTVNASLVYFFGYRYQLLYADQKSYLITSYQTGMLAAQQVLKIILLLTTRSFALYYAAEMLSQFALHLLLTRKANKLYPQALGTAQTKLSPDQRRGLLKNIRAMALHSIGGAVLNGTDNLLIARFTGVSSVGLYANYTLPLRPVNSLYDALFQSGAASLGNLAATACVAHKRRVFEDAFFMVACCSGVLCTGLVVLLSPFVALWVGDAYVMNAAVVQLMVANLYLQLLRRLSQTMKSAEGLFRNDRYKAIAEACVNLGVSIWLGLTMGIPGVLLGTIISQVVFPIWVEGFVLYRHAFHTSAWVYAGQFVGYTLAFLVNAGLSIIIAGQISGTGIGAFLLKGLVCVEVSVVVYGVLCLKNPHFSYAYSLLKRFFKR
jgi:O-antigen/teichoic acid export membrane protein